MTIYTRPDELVFAESAKNGEVVDFPDIPRGWGITFDQTEGEPPMEWFNSVSQRQDKAIRYLMQRGLTEWSSTEDYPVGGLVSHSGLYWQSLQDNKGNEPQDNSSYWSKFADVEGLRNDLGTAAFTNIGNASGQVPDMSFFDALATGTSGYQKFPSGVLIQWGGSLATAGGTVTATYPIAFQSIKCVTTSSGVTTVAACCAMGVDASGSLTQLRIYARSPNSTTGANIAVNWMAIGTYK